MLKRSLKYALSCGVFLVVVFHLSYLVGSNPLIDLSHLALDAFLIGMFIFFAAKEYKRYDGDGIFYFWQGMTIGFWVYILGVLVFFGAQTIYFQLNSDAVINYQTDATNFLNEKAAIYNEKFGEEVFQAQLDAIRQVNSWDLIFSSTMKKIIAGFFVSPVISIILRNKHK